MKIRGNEDSPYVFVDDISGGQENFRIAMLNNVNWATLPFISYTPSNVLVSESLIEEFESVPVPCKCEETCSDDCSCGFGCGIAYQCNTLREEFIRGTSKPIIECSELCPCDKNCPNRVVQKGIQITLQIFMTEDKGFGVKTVSYIPKLAFVCEYAGEVIDKNEAQERLKNRSANEPNYIFVLNEYSELTEQSTCTIIDPTITGNVGRYLNHSCSPNLVPVAVRANSMIPKICFFANRDIMPHEELTYDYGKNVCAEKTDDLNKKKCNCNSEHCLGFLPFDDSWLC